MDPELAPLTVRWEENGELVVDELDREVLSNRGGWATIAYLAREKDRENGGFGEPKIIVRRYRKRAKGHEVVAKLSLPLDQAEVLASAIGRWRSTQGA